MNKSDFEQDLQQQLTSMSRDRQPERDLWTGIELALVNQSDAPRHNKFARFGLVAAAVALFGWVSMMSLTSQDAPLDGNALVASLSDQHQQQKNALLVQFKDQPALTNNWQEQVAELDEAALAIKAALKNEPNNIALLKLLQNVYQQQISLIERVHSPKWSQI